MAATPFLPGTCIPRMFANDDKLWMMQDAVLTPCVRELPTSAFTSAELFATGKETLPDGFKCVPTPSSIVNCVRLRKAGKACKQQWISNLWRLLMGPEYREIVGRYIRTDVDVPGFPCHRTLYLELIFSSYSIAFDVSALDKKGVLFVPLFVPLETPNDPNAYARAPDDPVVHRNVIPPAPPGAYMPFCRLPSRGKRTANGKCLAPDVLASGSTVFPPSQVDDLSKYQAGGIGFVVHRHNLYRRGFVRDVDGHDFQPLILYCRFAFGDLALASPDVQMREVQAVVDFALRNSFAGCGALKLERVHVFDIPAADLLTAHVNAVDVDAETERIIARWVQAENPSADYDACMMEARCRCALVNVGYSYGNVVHIYKPSEEAAVVMERRMEMTCAQPSTISLPATVLERAFEPEEETHVRKEYAEARAQAEVARELGVASTVLHHMAPPDVAAFGARPVVVFGLRLQLRLGVPGSSAMSVEEKRRAYRMAGDVGTRFMWDMMLQNPQLLVCSTRTETLLTLFTDKAPGVLSVSNATHGQPVRETRTSNARRIRRPHPAMGDFELQTVPATAAVLKSKLTPTPSLAHPDRNPMLRALLRGPALPTQVAGCEVSIYKPGTKANTTHFSGTCHSWPVYARFVELIVRTPQTPEYKWGLFSKPLTSQEQEAAIDFLHPPLYNCIRNRIWAADGGGGPLRKWAKSYGVDPEMLDNARFVLQYPATEGEYRNPRALKIWEYKRCAEAVLQWMSRYGRITRRLLDNHRRCIRRDFASTTLNYVYMTKARFPDAPVANLVVSAYNAFGRNFMFGEHCLESQQKMTEGIIEDPILDDVKSPAAKDGDQASDEDPSEDEEAGDTTTDEDEDEDLWVECTTATAIAPSYAVRTCCAPLPLGSVMVKP